MGSLISTSGKVEVPCESIADKRPPVPPRLSDSTAFTAPSLRALIEPWRSPARLWKPIQTRTLKKITPLPRCSLEYGECSYPLKRQGNLDFAVAYHWDFTLAPQFGGGNGVLRNPPFPSFGVFSWRYTAWIPASIYWFLHWDLRPR
jgi:hypothetical protein